MKTVFISILVVLIFITLQTSFVTLKLLEVLSWRWGWIISPLWILIGIMTLLLLVVLIMAIVKKQQK